MDIKLLTDYQAEDLVADESFLNYHFNTDKNDRLFWEDWLFHHPEKAALVKLAVEMIDALSLSIPEGEYQEEFTKLKKVIDEPVSFSKKLKQFPHVRLKKKREIEYTTVVLLVLVCIWFWLFQPFRKPPEKLSEIVNNSAVPMVITLSDSSVVTLAANSYIQFPSTFKTKERNVYLHGNAGFTVKKDIKHPFKVHAENIVATVLGTVFNIRKSKDSIVVELLKGKLNVEILNAQLRSQQSVLLLPNERAVYVRNDNHLYKNIIQQEPTLSFDKNNFQEVAEQIKNAFEVTLINESPKKNWRFTGEFKNSTAKEIVENICLVENLSFEIKGDTILIK